MTSVPALNPKSQFLDANGNPLVLGTIDVYLAGTTTRTTSWQDKAQTTPNTNPIELDGRGECLLWLDVSLTYKFVLKNAAGVTQWTVDNISGAAGVASLVSFIQAGTGAVSRTAQDKMRDTVSVKDFGAVGDGSTDDSAAIQAAIDDRAARGGGMVFVPAGTYLCNVVLKSGVVVSSGMGGQFGYGPGSITTTTFRQRVAGFVVDTPATAITNCGVHGINFKGIGAATAGGGVRFQSTTWSSVKGCQFDNFADQGVLKVAGNANTFEDILTTNCLLNRTRATQNGAVELSGGADDFMHRIEANPSLTGISDVNMRVCAIVVKAANVFAANCIGEFADYGWYVSGASCRLVNCRGDLNWGPGFNTNGASQYSNCTALNNGQATTNTYSGFLVNGQGDSFGNCLAKCTGGIVHKYGFEDSANFSAVSARNIYDAACRSIAHGTAAYSMVEFLGSAPMEPATPLRGTGATPDTTGTTFYIPTDGSPVTITNFLGGVPGKRLQVLGNAQVTIQQGTGLKTSTGANKTLVANRMYEFKYYNSVWYEQAPGVTSAYTITNAATDRAYDAAATTVAELANVLGTLISDLRTAGLVP